MKLAIYQAPHYIAFGKIVYAEDIHDLLGNKMSKADRKTWELIKYRDEQGRVICITREFMDDQGMTLEEVIDDWLEHGVSEDDDIACIPRKISFLPVEPVYL